MVRIPLNSPDQSGFTIVEIMIASGILLVLTLAIATMLFNANKQQSKIENRAQRADFIQATALDIRMRPVAP